MGGFGKKKDKVYRMVSSLYQGDFDPDEEEPQEAKPNPTVGSSNELTEPSLPSPAKQVSFRDQNPLLYLNLKNEYFRDSCIELMQVMTPVQLTRFNEMCFEDSSPYNHKMFYEIYGHKAVRFDDWVEDHSDKRRKLQFVIPDSNSQLKHETKVYATQRYLHSKQSFTLLTKYNLKSEKFSELDVETLLEGKSIQSGRFCSMITCKLFIYRDDLKKIPSKVIETLTEYFKHESHCWAKEIIEYRLVSSDRVYGKLRRGSLVTDSPATDAVVQRSQSSQVDEATHPDVSAFPAVERFTVDRSARDKTPLAFAERIPILGPFLTQNTQRRKWLEFAILSTQLALNLKNLGIRSTLSKIATNWQTRFGTPPVPIIPTKSKAKTQIEILLEELDETSRWMVHVQLLMTMVVIGIFLRALDII